MPSSGKAAASTALPQPPKTSQKVPKNSADSLFNMEIPKVGVVKLAVSESDDKNYILVIFFRQYC
jgi:hypothetical protein